MENSPKIHKKASVPESLYWFFLVNFSKFVRTMFLQNSTYNSTYNYTSRKRNIAIIKWPGLY